MLPILPFILEQAVANTLPAASSVCSGLQFAGQSQPSVGSCSHAVRGSAQEVVRAGLPAHRISPLHPRLSSRLREPFGTISAKIRVKPPGTKVLLALYSAVPAAKDSHGSTQ